MLDETTNFITQDADRVETNQVMWMNHIQGLNPEQLISFLTQLEDMWDIWRHDDEAVPSNWVLKISSCLKSSIASLAYHKTL